MKSECIISFLSMCRVFPSLSTTAININKQSIFLTTYQEYKAYISNCIYSVWS